jgi:membrane-bound metal-dependent hydrolase YbcI (DUF457 family)
LKEFTHYVFSAGLAFYALSVLRNLDAYSLVLALWLSFSVNYAIDILGHVTRDGKPSRSWFTHSVFTAPVWGGLLGGFTLAAIFGLLKLRPTPAEFALWVVLGMVVAIGHLLLDSLTEAGIFFTRRRIALAHFSYRNTPLNLGFVVAGICLTVASFRV